MIEDLMEDKANDETERTEGDSLPPDRTMDRAADADDAKEEEAVRAEESDGGGEESADALEVDEEHPAENARNEGDAAVSEEEASSGENGNEQPESVDEDEEEETEDSPLPLASVVEAVLFAAREPLKVAQIARAVGKRTRQEAVRKTVEELNIQYLETSRAFEIAEISGRYQLMSRPEYARHIMRIYPKRELNEKDKSHRLTPTALDTLAIIAYKQPVTRGEIEHIRGVACGSVLKTLIERGTVRVAGKRTDLVGQPRVYGTTEAFLAEFGLGSLDELPLRNDFLGILGDETGAVELFPEEGESARETEESSAPLSESAAGSEEEQDEAPLEDAPGDEDAAEDETA